MKPKRPRRRRATFKVVNDGNGSEHVAIYENSSGHWVLLTTWCYDGFGRLTKIFPDTRPRYFEIVEVEKPAQRRRR